jgi:hypothetical protein
MRRNDNVSFAADDETIVKLNFTAVWVFETRNDP